MRLDLEAVAGTFAHDPRVVLVTVFGSAQEGEVPEGSDVDIAVLLSPEMNPTDFYAFYQEMATKLPAIDKLDLIDLNHADSILAFEALCGRRLFVRDPDAVAAFSSLVARQYEDDMLHVA